MVQLAPFVFMSLLLRLSVVSEKCKRLRVDEKGFESNSLFIFSLRIDPGTLHKIARSTV